MSDDERKIREVIATWHAATRAGDTDKVLTLMADDVVFMVPGKKPFGKKQFAESSKGLEKVQIESQGDIEELELLGDWAFCRTHLTVTMTPPGEKPHRRSGYTMSIFRKQADGKWLLARDANMLAPDESPK